SRTRNTGDRHPLTTRRREGHPDATTRPARKPAARVSAGRMTRRDSRRPPAVATIAREANPSCERQPRRGRGVLRRDPDRHGAGLLRRHQTPTTTSRQRAAAWTAAPTVGVVGYDA